jgi:hypothetical protein
VSTNEFNCLSNALLQASLRCELPVAYAVPEHVRELVQGVDVRDVRAVTLHQCPQHHEAVVGYEIEVFLRDGSRKKIEFQVAGSTDDHDTYVLYDRNRDGLMKHMHLLH